MVHEIQTFLTYSPILHICFLKLNIYIADRFLHRSISLIFKSSDKPVHLYDVEYNVHWTTEQ